VRGIIVFLPAALLFLSACAGSRDERLQLVRVGRGPQETITCPEGSVNISASQSITAATNERPAGTSFCIQAGVHLIATPIVPKTGNTYTGEYGAVLDGSTWASGVDQTASAFRAQNQDVDDVTIRNLLIQEMPWGAVMASREFSNNWIVDHNDIYNNSVGVGVGNAFVVTNNLIHHNILDPTNPDPALRGGGYGGFQSSGSLWVNNDISFNGPEQKMVGTTNTTFRGNDVHDNNADGIWFDADNTGVVIEGNHVYDNGRIGIDHEVSGGAIIRNNVIERNPTGLFISTSKDVEAYGNTFRDNYDHQVELFLDTSAVGGGAISWDLTNNYIHDNVMIGSALTTLPTPIEFYDPAQKGNRFVNNTYDVPDRSGRYWAYGGDDRTFAEWQAVGQDITGSARGQSVGEGLASREAVA
jgi:parallel beta-helix repeat protein